MFFFAFIRAFGLLWFLQEYVESDLPGWAEHFLMSGFWMFDGLIMLKTLSSVSWKRAVLLMVPLRLVSYITLSLASVYIIISEAFLIVILPLFLNKDKERSAGYSVLYIAALMMYQGLMVLGRGYPLLSKFSPSWQILLTVDYRLFLLGLFLLKGVVVNMPPGCWLLIGPFDELAAKIGKTVLKPFSQLLR